MIGDEIKKFRKLKNLTQQELGDLIGLSGVTIMRYEKDQREPSKDVIQKIANALETTPIKLMGWDEKYNPNGKLSSEVKLIEQIKDLYGKDSAELLHFYSLLDDQGKEKAYSYIEYLVEQQKKIPGVLAPKI